VCPRYFGSPGAEPEIIDGVEVDEVVSVHEKNAVELEIGESGLDNSNGINAVELMNFVLHRQLSLDTMSSDDKEADLSASWSLFVDDSAASEAEDDEENAPSAAAMTPAVAFGAVDKCNDKV